MRHTLDGSTSMCRISQLIAALALAVLGSAPAGADIGLPPPPPTLPTCLAVLQGHIDWVDEAPLGPGNYFLDFAYVSQAPSQKATYGEGRLRLERFLGTTRFIGQGRAYASTDRWSFPCEGISCPPDGHLPFDPRRADAVFVVVGAPSGHAYITVGGNSKAVDLQCDTPGTLHGAVNGASTPARYVFTLKRVFERQPNIAE